ncbi:MAG: DUF975 family protein [Phycisphaerae bacterium]|nr:DUF975 family protein [Phycisphaerae bacterium]
MSQWYCGVSGDQYGPVEQHILESWIAQGKVKSTDYVWSEGMGDWAEAGTVFPQLFAGGASGPPPVNSMVPAAPPGGTGGQTANCEITRQARELLRGRWSLPIAFSLLLFLLSAVPSNLVSSLSRVQLSGSIVTLIIGGPLTLGGVIFFMTFSRGRRADLGMLFAGFKYFSKALGAYLLMAVFTLLWLLLLIVPGIIAAYRYSQTFYLLADDKTLGPLEAIRKSKQLMVGRKWKLFCLGLRFVGWSLLCILTLGIGLLWLWPYMAASFARFYDDLAPAGEQLPTGVGETGPAALTAQLPGPPS